MKKNSAEAEKTHQNPEPTRAGSGGSDWSDGPTDRSITCSRHQNRAASSKTGPHVILQNRTDPNVSAEPAGSEQNKEPDRRPEGEGEGGGGVTPEPSFNDKDPNKKFCRVHQQNPAGSEAQNNQNLQNQSRTVGSNR